MACLHKNVNCNVIADFMISLYFIMVIFDTIKQPKQWIKHFAVNIVELHSACCINQNHSLSAMPVIGKYEMKNIQ